MLNYYTKNQVDSLIYNINLVDYYTKTEIDTQLIDHATISYLQDNYMTTLPITETLMNNYASITLADNLYDKTYLDNQIAGLVSTDYSNLKYTNSVDLFTNYYNKIETGSLLANKVSTTGDASISGNLNVTGRILIDGSHLNVQPKSSTSSETLVLDQSMSSEFGSDSHGINVYGRQGGNSHLKFYNSRSGSVCNVLIDGSLDVGPSQAQSSIKAYVNHIGKTGYVEMEARWPSQGVIHFKTNHTAGELFFAVKDSLRDKIHMHVGNDIIYNYENTTIAGNLDVGTT